MQILIAMKKITKYIMAACLTLSVFVCLSSCNKSADVNTVAPGTGTGGSLARFTISLNHLYVVDSRQLYTFSISDQQNPVKVNTTDIGFDVETIYVWSNKLFIGSRDAMYVYSIADPGKPELLGTASHVRACDPVVANDSVAYVTVRSGSSCGGEVNALFVYDLKNVLQPVQKSMTNLGNPHGLGISGNTLFVCDANNGLKIFDISAQYNPYPLGTITGETFYDCIPDGNLLICMIEGGTAIYDITDRNHVILKAKITE
jgi:hypothetical protein